MLNLAASVSAEVFAVTSAAGLVEIATSFVDFISGVATPGSGANRRILTATTTSLLSGIAAGVRNVKVIHVRNDDLVTANGIEILVTDGVNVVTLWKGTLLAGEALLFTDVGWQALGVTGIPKSTNTVGHFRLYDSTGVTCGMQGTVTITGGGGDMTLDNNVVTLGQLVTIVTFGWTEPNA